MCPAIEKRWLRYLRERIQRKFFVVNLFRVNFSEPFKENHIYDILILHVPLSGYF